MGKVRYSCWVKFRMKLWCGVELGFGFKLRVSIRVILGVKVPCQ